jgi:hypothetical protein
MLVEEDQVFIEVNENFVEASRQIAALAAEAGQVVGTSSVQPKAVQIGNTILWSFLYLLEYEFRIYGEFSTIYIKYLRVKQ